MQTKKVETFSKCFFSADVFNLAFVDVFIAFQTGIAMLIRPTGITVAVMCRICWLADSVRTWDFVALISKALFSDVVVQVYIVGEAVAFVTSCDWKWTTTARNNFVIDLVEATVDVGAIVDTCQGRVTFSVEMILSANAFISFLNWNTFTCFAAVTVFTMINAGLIFIFVQVQVLAFAKALESLFCQCTLTAATVRIGAVVGACFFGVVVKVEIVIGTDTLVTTQKILACSSSAVWPLNSALIESRIKNTTQ